MDNNAAIDFRNPALVRKVGMSALQKELGTVGTAYFMRQFNLGKGDYTAEREELLAGMTLEDIIKNVRETDREKQ
jgi:hypothetical protein